jgi:WD40 repeat protein
MAELSKRSDESLPWPDVKKPRISDTGISDDTPGERTFTELWKKESCMVNLVLTATMVYTVDNETVVVHDTVTMRKITEIAPGNVYIHVISLSRDGERLFVACSDGTVKIINLFTGNKVILRGHVSPVDCIIQGEGTDVLTCSWDSTIRRWNMLTGACLMTYEGHTGWVYSIIYDEATKRIFSASNDGTIIVWNGETGEKTRVTEGHVRSVSSLVRVDSTTIASCSCDGTIKLWNTMTLTCTKTIPNGRIVYSVAATPDGQYLISGSDDNKVRVWSVATGQCLHTLSHHNSYVYRVTVSP